MTKFATDLPPEMCDLLRRNGVEPERVCEVAFHWNAYDPPPTLDVKLYPVADHITIELVKEEL